MVSKLEIKTTVNNLDFELDENLSTNQIPEENKASLFLIIKSK